MKRGRPRRALIRGLLLLTTFASGTLAAQAPSQRGLSGQVVNALTHRPVRRAVVKVSTNDEEWYEFTDVEGKFRFATLAAGDYSLTVRRDLFTNTEAKIERSQFDSPTELRIEMLPQGLIAGGVVDGVGEGLPAHIDALVRRSAGKMEVVGGVETNDLG